MELTAEQISEFKDSGVLVVEDVLSEEEVDHARACLHEDIYRLTGVRHGDENWADIGSRLKGPGMYIYYAKWKLLNIHLHPKVTASYEQLLSDTYGPGNVHGFEHPFEACHNHLAMVDRVCYRLPSSISGEGGLALHLDRNPLDPYLQQAAGGLDKWRPIQAFVALTDHVDSNSGGLRVVRGFHKRIDEYFKNSKEAQDACGHRGEFFRMNAKSHARLYQQLEVVYAPKGSLVLWDSRLPHATCDRLEGFDTREVVYTGFLPNTELNRRFVQEQKEHIQRNEYPLYGPRGGDDGAISADKDWTLDELSVEQRIRLGFS